MDSYGYQHGRIPENFLWFRDNLRPENTSGDADLDGCTSLHAMRFVGPPFTFGVSMLANNVSIIGPNAVTTVGDKVFWMDRENFFVYTGRVQVIPCTLLRYVFDDINLEQNFKCFAAVQQDV